MSRSARKLREALHAVADALADMVDEDVTSAPVEPGAQPTVARTVPSNDVARAFARSVVRAEGWGEPQRGKR